MTIDGSKILAKVKANKSDRKNVTLYLSEAVYKKFQAACGELSASEVLEELLKEFIATSKKR